MGFFGDMKEIWNKSAIENVNDILASNKLEYYTFKELITTLYQMKMGSYDPYVSCIILMEKYKFYDPYIFKIAKGTIWKLKKTDDLNLTNIENSIVQKYIEEFSECSKEGLEIIIKEYEKIKINRFDYKESSYYYTCSNDDGGIINHYSAVAAQTLLFDNYGIEIEFDDVSDENEDDIREKKYKERVEKIEKLALKGAVSIASKYIPDDKEEK